MATIMKCDFCGLTEEDASKQKEWRGITINTNKIKCINIEKSLFLDACPCCHGRIMNLTWPTKLAKG